MERRIPLFLLTAISICLSACVFDGKDEHDSGDDEVAEGTTAGDCVDRADNDGDGAFDCDDDGCAGSPDCESPADADSDGYTTEDGDCDDGNAAVYPGAEETCATDADDDCDGNSNEQDAADCTVFYADGDGDGYGDPAVGRCRCYPESGEVVNNTDSDDSDRTVHESDADDDGYTTGDGDCDDSDSSVHPGATETCATEADDDCDGNPNEQDVAECEVFYADNDGDGYGDPAVGRCRCFPAAGEVDDNTDSNDSDASAH